MPNGSCFALLWNVWRTLLGKPKLETLLAEQQKRDARRESRPILSVWSPEFRVSGTVHTRPRCLKSLNSVQVSDLSEEKDAAFELLDSLTRSGALPLQHSELHLLVVATQCFQRTVMDTVIQVRLRGAPISCARRT